MTGDFVAQHVDLVDRAELLEHAADVVLVHVARHLADEHLDGVGVRLVARHAPVTDRAAIGRRRSETKEKTGLDDGE